MDADVIVIGGGAAGLSGATTLARARRRVVVVDDGRPRNAPAEGVHSFLTRDGVAPAELLRLGREELAAYGATVRTGTATTARRVEGGFEVGLGDGAVLTARRLLVTTGSTDELPDVAGLAEHWGRGVVHCPYCHGWEVQDQVLAVLATHPMSVMQALVWSQWTDDLTLLLHAQAPPDDDQAALLAARGVRVVTGRVERIVSTDGRIAGVDVAGEQVACTALVVGSFVRARSGVLDGLGVEVRDFEMGGASAGTYVPVDAMTGATSVPGVHAAGNVADPPSQVVTAAGNAVRAAAGINLDLVLEDARSVVAGG